MTNLYKILNNAVITANQLKQYVKTHIMESNSKFEEQRWTEQLDHINQHINDIKKMQQLLYDEYNK